MISESGFQISLGVFLMTEEVMIEKIRSRNPAGLEALMNRYLSYVSTVVWNILRNAMPVEDGEEIVSDVFLAAWRQPEALRPGSIKAWLGAVARNKAKNRMREINLTFPLEDALDIPGPDDPPGEYERALERQLRIVLKDGTIFWPPETEVQISGRPPKFDEANVKDEYVTSDVVSSPFDQPLDLSQVDYVQYGDSRIPVNAE